MEPKRQEILKRLQDLDNDLSQLTERDTFDPRVRFDAQIVPRSKSEQGVRWYDVTLSVQAQPDFSQQSIERVVYVLHPTFQPNEIAVANRDTNFALRIETWGDFHAMAIVVLNSGETINLIKYLPIGVEHLR